MVRGWTEKMERKEEKERQEKKRVITIRNIRLKVQEKKNKVFLSFVSL
jgi:hypothetical protein